MPHKKIFYVSELNNYIKRILEDDARLSNLWVKGEISNFKAHSSGHIYFVLKDGGSCVRCVMFRSRASGLLFAPQNGMNVIIRGYVSVYERDGQYQVYVEEVQPDGVGALHIAFEQLKAKLEKEGLFDVARKRQIPLVPRKIGVVTSATGAAWQDLQKIIFRRFSNVHLVLVAAAVQGENAPAEICRGIEILNSIKGIDVIIVGRGGGSLEELWAFNTEEVARAIFSSGVPVISAVGHQTDYSIADFVADKRAATPSAAAEMVVPVKKDLLHLINMYQDRLQRVVSSHMAVSRQQLAHYRKSWVFVHYRRIFQEKLQHMDILKQLLERSTLSYIKECRNQFQLLAEKMDMLSPLTTLSRGYAFCRKEGEQKVMTSTALVEVGDGVEVFLHEGGFTCRVMNKWKGATGDGGK